MVDPGAVGEVFRVVPGVVEFGLVDGCVVVPDAVGFDPGVAPVGGAVVLPVGGAAWPGVARPAAPGAPVPAPPAPALPAPFAPPAPPACATTQVAQPRIRESSISLRADINEASGLEFSGSPFGLRVELLGE